MAGDVKTTQSGIVIPPGLPDDILGVLREIRDVLRGAGRQDTISLPVGFQQQGFVNAFDNFGVFGYVRLHVHALVMRANGAGTVGITIGTRTLLWNVPGNRVVTIPYHTTIERGSNVHIADGATAQGEPLYLIGTPE